MTQLILRFVLLRLLCRQGHYQEENASSIVGGKHGLLRDPSLFHRNFWAVTELTYFSQKCGTHRKMRFWNISWRIITNKTQFLYLLCVMLTNLIIFNTIFMHRFLYMVEYICKGHKWDRDKRAFGIYYYWFFTTRIRRITKNSISITVDQKEVMLV